MKKKRFSVEQIVAVLKHAKVGVPVRELMRQVGISEQTFYRWKQQVELLLKMNAVDHSLTLSIPDLTAGGVDFESESQAEISWANEAAGAGQSVISYSLLYTGEQPKLALRCSLSRGESVEQITQQIPIEKTTPA